MGFFQSFFHLLVTFYSENAYPKTRMGDDLLIFPEVQEDRYDRDQVDVSGSERKPGSTITYKKSSERAPSLWGQLTGYSRKALVETAISRLKRISQEYKALLEELGFIWNPINDGWEDMFLKLCMFKEANRHLNISNKKSEPKLLSWINWQKYNYKNGKLNNERTQKLINLGIHLDK